ncbi:MAG TPA: alanine racemase [Actinomycetota bacterium]
MPATEGPAASTWVGVSRDALARNYERVAAFAGVPVCAVVKANAYGHGLVETARVFAGAGAPMLAVTRLGEARALRAGGIDTPVFLLAPAADVREAVALACEVTVSSADQIAALPDGARAHLKVDTGMSRLGVLPPEALEAARAIAARATLAAVWTHLPDGATERAARRLSTFAGVVAAVRDAFPDVRAHALNSAGLLAHKGAAPDMVRVGTLLYGENPPGARAGWPLAETFAWFGRVAQVKRVPAGASVGYGPGATLRRARLVATIPVGYADGLALEIAARPPRAREIVRRSVSFARARGRAVQFENGTAPIVGRVSMQMVTVDVTDVPGVEAGSVARLPARRLVVSPLIERVYR